MRVVGSGRVFLSIICVFALAMAPAAVAESSYEEEFARLVQKGPDDPAPALASLARGASANAVVAGATLLEHALRRGHTAVADALLRWGADPNARTSEDQPLVMVAKDQAQLALLLDHGADAAASGPGAITPLHAAAAALGGGEIALLVAAGALVDAVDEKQRTPLMIAAELGRAAEVEALLGAGASPFVQSASGVTALSLARDRGHAEIVKSLVASVAAATSPVVTSTALRPAPGADLRSICESAIDGQVIVLGAGEYKGPVIADAKSLRIVGDPGGKTVLLGGEEQLVAIATGKGRLMLQDLTLRPAGSATMGVYVKESTAILQRCALESFSEYAVYAEGGEVEALNTAFNGGSAPALVGLENSRVTARNCAFNGCTKGGIVVQGGGSLDATRCVFRDTPQAIGVQSGAARVQVRHNDIQCKEATAEAAIAIETSDCLLVANNILNRAGRGIVLRGALKAPAVVAGNVVLGAPMGIYASVQYEGPGVALILGRNQIFGAVECGAFADGTTSAAFYRNFVVSPKGAAVAVRQVARIGLDRDILLASEWALQIEGQCAVTLNDTRLRGQLAPVDAKVARDPATQRFEQALAIADSRDQLIAAETRLLAAAASMPAIEAESFTGPMHEFLDALTKVSGLARSLGRVTLKIIDRLGASCVVAFDAYEAAGLEPGDLPANPADLKAPSATAASRLRATCDDAEAGVCLPAGWYWLVPHADPKLARRVALAEGETIEAERRARDSLILTFTLEHSRPAVRVLVTLESRARMQAALARMHGTSFWRTWTAMPRPGATPADRQAAVDLARARLASLATEPQQTEGMSAEAFARLSHETLGARRAAERILMVAGDESDVARLIETCPGAALTSVMGRAAIVAYLESRLGQLESGALFRALSGDDPAWRLAAATQLHRMGLGLGDAIIIDSVRDATDIRGMFDATFALLDTPGPEVLAAMRALYDRCRTGIGPSNNPQWPPLPVCLYLLAYGDESDMRRVAGIEHPAYYPRFFSALVVDSLPLMALAADRGWYAEMALAAAFLRRLPPARAQAIADELEGRLVLAAAANDPESPRTILNTYEVLASYCRPNRRTALLFYDAIASHQDAPWVGSTWERDLIFKRKADGQDTLKSDRILDYISPDEFAEAAKAAGVREKVFGFDLLEASHRICSRAYMNTADDWHDGAERRAYVLRNLEHEGAISGMLEVRPRIVGQRLRLDLRFLQEAHYASGSLIDFREGKLENWAHHKYLVDGARALIGELRLRRGDRVLPVLPQGASGRALIYEAELDIARFDGLYLEVELDFLGEKHALIFDLFAGDAARTRRRLARELGDVQAAALARPGDAVAALAVARTLAKIGLVDEAIGAYAAAAIGPEREAVKEETVEWLTRRGLHDHASKVLAEEAAAHADDAGLQRDLAGVLYRAESFAAAAAAAALALQLEPDDQDMMVLRSACLYLAGDRAGASELLGALPPGEHRRRSLALWYLSGRHESEERAQPAAAELMLSAESADCIATDRQLALLLLGKQSAYVAREPYTRVADRCREQCYLGYLASWAKNQEQARIHFAAAVAIGDPDLLERKMAEIELATIEAGE